MKFKILLFILFSIHILNAQCWSYINTGDDHSIAIGNNGSLWMWGRGDTGQLGNGSNSSFYLPNQIGIDTDWKEAVGGVFHTLALKNNGTLWATGNNNYGQTGTGTPSNIFMQVGTDTNWKTIEANGLNSYAIKIDGTLWAWGDNSNGGVGDGTLINRSTPVQIGADTDWKEISAGDSFALALKNNGTLWVWGQNTYGAFGNGTTSITPNPTPSQIGTQSDWKTIATCKGGTSIAIKVNGTLWAWGDNSFKQLGNNTTNPSYTPLQIDSATNWESVSGGYGHIAAVKTNRLYAHIWGDNYYGQWGSGNTTNLGIILANSTLQSPFKIICGGSYILMLNIYGDIWAAGKNSGGQLGDNSNIDRTSPVSINCPAVLNSLTFIEETSFTIFPNPVQNTLILQSQEHKNIRIFDLSGKILFVSNETLDQVDVSNFKNGVYLIQLETETGYKQVQKFIKK